MQESIQALIKLDKDERVKEGQELRSLLRKDFTLGMTRYVCRNGTLGEGHECLTLAEKYAQSCREYYTRAFEASTQSAQAKKFYASYLKAKDKYEQAYETGGAAARLEAEAEMELAQLSLMRAEDNAKDLMDQLDEFRKVMHELRPKFREMYPEGVEQAEPDNWQNRLSYRMSVGKEVQSIPLPEKEKREYLENLKTNVTNLGFKRYLG